MDIQDDVAAIGTNNQSIVSKRSVEVLYYQYQSWFLEYFMPPEISNRKKPPRRSPLVNRGYWLRMNVIKNTVLKFMSQKSNRIKVIVNLGCGDDTLPLHIKNLYNFDQSQVKFIDVDYPELIARKTSIISGNEKLQETFNFPSLKQVEHRGIIVSDFGWYITVGCDLGDFDMMCQVLDDFLSIDESDILFVAEVSITYMPLKKANKIIEWTASHHHASFVLLEQIMPVGPDHPFARTMLSHYDKIAPLQSIHHYPTLSDQCNRFRSYGYNHVEASSLWEIYNRNSFEEYHHAENIEPFDEWEEFISHLTHHFILQASNYHGHNASLSESSQNLPIEKSVFSILSTGPLPPAGIGARLKSPLTVRCNDNMTIFATQTLSNTNSWHVYGSSEPRSWPSFNSALGNFCHTLTQINPDTYIFVGGRKSPSLPSSACYLYNISTNIWTRTHNLPFEGRYRHCAVPIHLKDKDGVLIYGGKGEKDIVLGDFLIWLEQDGWFTAPCQQNTLKLFGASMTDTEIIGGLNSSAMMNSQVWRWSLEGHSKDNCRIHLTESSTPPLFRFGAFATNLPLVGTVVIGGVSNAPFPASEEVLILQDNKWVSNSLFDDHRPFLVGCSIARIDDSIFITGGGAPCYTFGSCFNNSWYLIGTKVSLDNFSSEKNGNFPSQWKYCANNIALQVRSSDQHQHQPQPSKCSLPAIVPTMDMKEFVSSLIKLTPMTVKNVKMGRCSNTWNSNHLVDRLRSTKVSIHESTSRFLNFSPKKSFIYLTVLFPDFLSKILAGKHVYLRALASSGGTHAAFKRPANFHNDFPEIADDFVIDPVLSESVNLKERLHSSVLRVSGDVCLWIHYDVMSNFYFQIRGSKRFILFPPSEVLKLKFEPGSAVSPVDIAVGEWGGSKFMTVKVEAGDVLFIPRLWAHATYSDEYSREESAFSTTVKKISIAINVFWRDQDDKAYAMGKDIYGSRDVAAYEQSRETLKSFIPLMKEKLGAELEVKTKLFAEYLVTGVNKGKGFGWYEMKKIRDRFDSLASDVKAFYLLRLADEITHCTSNQD